jgi:hypothetical protein
METIQAGYAHAVMPATRAATSGQGRSGCLSERCEHPRQQHSQQRNGSLTLHRYADSSRSPVPVLVDVNNPQQGMVIV